MQALSFPTYPFRLRTSGVIREIWDETRKKWIVITPEEWVRQHLLEYLVQDKRFPRGLLAIEKGLRVNGMLKRTDVVVFGKNLKAFLLAECKAPGVKLTQKTFDQAARYNMTLRVPYLIVTNGLEHFFCHIDFENQSYSFQTEIPDFTAISSGL